MRKNNNSFAMAFIFLGLGLWFAMKGVVIWIILSFVFIFLALFSSGKPPRRERGKLNKKMKNSLLGKDLKKYNVELPKDREMQRLLNKIYRKYEVGLKKIPDLQFEMEELAESMWENLKFAADVFEGRRMLGEVLRGWPVPVKISQNELSQKIVRLQKATRVAQNENYNRYGMSL